MGCGLSKLGDALDRKPLASDPLYDRSQLGLGLASRVLQLLLGVLDGNR